MHACLHAYWYVGLQCTYQRRNPTRCPVGLTAACFTHPGADGAEYSSCITLGSEGTQQRKPQQPPHKNSSSRYGEWHYQHHHMSVAGGVGVAALPATSNPRRAPQKQKLGNKTGQGTPCMMHPVWRTDLPCMDQDKQSANLPSYPTHACISTHAACRPKACTT